MKVYINTDFVALDASWLPEGTKKYRQHFLRVMGDMIKYKVMWALRHLEHEMDNEEGHIIIDVEHDSGNFHVNGFSDNLHKKIEQLLDNTDIRPGADIK